VEIMGLEVIIKVRIGLLNRGREIARLVKSNKTRESLVVGFLVHRNCKTGK